MSLPDSPTPDALIGDLAELDILSRIFPRLPGADATIVGPGDDAAVLAAPDGRYVVTTDMMIHGPDFRLAWSTPYDLGWKAAATNLSDVAAMGAVPTALVVAIAVPTSAPVSLLEGIADGLREACAELAPGCGVVGGDLSVSDTLTLAITAFGDLRGREPVLRSGARAGDIVAISGGMGLAGAGIRLLFAEGVDDAGEPDAARAAALRQSHGEIIEAQLRPRPPIADGILAADAGATSMLDVSDGLALDGSRIAKASSVTFDLDSSSLGANPALSLAGGEDHALLATFPAGSDLPGGFRPIGQVVAGGDASVTVDGNPYSGAFGWDPYHGWDGHAG